MNSFSKKCELTVVLLLVISLEALTEAIEIKEEAFQNCYIISIDSETEFAIDISLTVLTRLRFTRGRSNIRIRELYGQAIATLEQNFKSNKLTCHVIYISLSDENFSSLYDFSWLGNCARYDHVAPCYYKYTYLVAIISPVQTIRYTMTSTRLPFYSYKPLLNQSKVQITLVMGHPCNTVMTVNLSSATIELQARDELDCLFREILQNCPVSWIIDKLGFSHTDSILTGSTTIELNHFHNKSPISSKHPINLVALAVRSLNNSGKNSRYSHGQVFERRHGLFFPRINVKPYMHAGSSQMTGVYSLEADMEMFFTQQTYYNFITCDGRVPFLSFASFYLPFQLNLWISMSVSYIFVFLFLSGAFRYLSLRERPLTMLYSIIFEQNLYLSKASQKIDGLKFCLVSVLLITLLLTNLYRGSLTSDLTATIPSTRLKYVNEAVDKAFKVLFPVVKGSFLYYKVVETQLRIPKNATAARDYLLDLAAYDSNFIAALIGSIEGSNKLNYQTVADAIDIQWAWNYSVEENIMGCNKTMYIGSPLELNRMLEVIQRVGNRKKLYTGTDKYLSHPLAWIFPHMSWDRMEIVRKGFQAVIQSGIFEHFHENVVTSYRCYEAPVIRSLSTDSGFILSTLVIYATSIAISVAAFVYEFMPNSIILKFRIQSFLHYFYSNPS